MGIVDKHLDLSTEFPGPRAIVSLRLEPADAADSPASARPGQLLGADEPPGLSAGLSDVHALEL